MIRVRPLAATAAALLLLLATAGGAAASETDYLPDNDSWNGLSDLVATARGLGLPVDFVERLDWSEIDADPTCVLLWIYPRQPPPVEQLLRYLQRGGRLLVADDHGAAAPLYRTLGIQRYDGSRIRARRHYDGNHHLPIAERGSVAHPLVGSVGAVVTNHPAYFRSRLPTLLGFDRGHQQVMVAGELGRGRFVALSDPSILINNMLRFGGNLRLAKNLLRHLARPGRDRLVLLTGHVEVQGDLSPDGQRGRAVRIAREFNGFVGRINDFALTSAGMRALAFVVSLLLVAAIAVLLPLPRRDLDGHWIRPGGDREPRPSGAWAAAVLRDELEDRLTELLDAPGPISTIHPQWLCTRVRERAGEKAAQSCARLLDALSHVPYTSDAATPAARISRRDLATIYDESARLLELLGAKDLAAVDADEAADVRSAATRPTDRQQQRSDDEVEEESS